MLARARTPVAVPARRLGAPVARPAAPAARMVSAPLRMKATVARPAVLRADNIRSGGGAYSEREAALENLSAKKKEKEDMERLVKMLKENPELAAALQKAAGNEAPAKEKKDKKNKKEKKEKKEKKSE